MLPLLPTLQFWHDVACTARAMDVASRNLSQRYLSRRLQQAAMRRSTAFIRRIFGTLQRDLRAASQYARWRRRRRRRRGRRGPFKGEIFRSDPWKNQSPFRPPSVCIPLLESGKTCDILNHFTSPIGYWFSTHLR